MKKCVWLAVVLAFVVAGVWGAWALWRARSDLVSLHVRNATVAEVIDSLRRQSRELIFADTNLTARITLDFTRIPLVDALNRVGTQAGALAGRMHAVHDSRFSLGRLEQALRAGAPIEIAGWRTVAPRLDKPTMLPLATEQRLPLEGGPTPGGPVRIMTEDVVVGPGGEPNQAQPGGKKSGEQKAGEAPVMIMRFGRSDNAGNAHFEAWTPERIVAPAELADKLPKDQPIPHTRSGAEALARQNRAQCVTLYALKQAPLGVGVDTLMRRPPDQGEASGGLPGAKASLGRPDDVEARIRREKLSQYQDLTPEQRVQRARESRGNLEPK